MALECKAEVSNYMKGWVTCAAVAGNVAAVSLAGTRGVPLALPPGLVAVVAVN
jgi:hypothetical protein